MDNGSPPPENHTRVSMRRAAPSHRCCPCRIRSDARPMSIWSWVAVVADLRTVVAHLEATIAPSRHIARHTIKQSHAVLRRVFDTAVRWRWIGHNPARDARPPRVAKPDPVPVPPEVTPCWSRARPGTTPSWPHASCWPPTPAPGGASCARCAGPRSTSSAASSASTGPSGRTVPMPTRRTPRTTSTAPSRWRRRTWPSWSIIDGAWSSGPPPAARSWRRTASCSRRHRTARSTGGRRTSTRRSAACAGASASPIR
jgi:hypothetical protein